MAEQLLSAKGITILRLKQVSERTGLSRSSIYDKMNPQSPRHDPNFPHQVKLGPGAVGWIESQIEAWLASRVSTNYAPVERIQPADNLNKEQFSGTPRILAKELIEAEESKKTRAVKNHTFAIPDAELPRRQAGKLNEVPISDIPRILEKDVIETEDMERKRIAIVRQILEEHAKRGERVFYKQVMIPTMLSTDIPADRKVIDKILADISETSHAENKVLLSVLVHEARVGGSRPSDVFFYHAKSLGYTYDYPDSFVEKQIRQLFEVYKNPASKSKGEPIWVEWRGRRMLTRT